MVWAICKGHVRNTESHCDLSCITYFLDIYYYFTQTGVFLNERHFEFLHKGNERGEETKALDLKKSSKTYNFFHRALLMLDYPKKLSALR